MILNHTFLKKLTLVLIVIFFASCDKDFNTLGSDIVGNENFTFNDGENFDVKAYNQKVGPVQTNNQPINQLGILNSPVFGITKASFVTQLSLASLKPTFINDIKIADIDSVIVTVPYYSTKLATEESGRGIYRLDSIYGPEAETLNLKVYRNGYYLRDFDPLTNFLTGQKYYSNEESNFDANKMGLPSGGMPLNDYVNIGDEVNENTSFVFSSKEYKKYKVTTTIPDPKEVESRSSPRMRLHLNKEYFLNEIIKAPADKLDNNNSFKDYFRGLYFQVQSGTTGRMASINFAQGDVTIYYKDATSTTDVTLIQKTIVMNMTGNTVNLLENTDNADYATAVSSPDEASDIYLKGGEGAQAYVDLFSDPAKLQELKDKKVLINEASLTFTINQDKMSNNAGIVEPQRIYVYNADNNRPILDYFFDGTTSSLSTKLGKNIYGGIIEKDVNKKGTQYKIRLTEHVKNIVNKDSTNVRLGVIVTESINLTSNRYLKTPVQHTSNSSKKFDRLPIPSVLSPIGTVLYGSNAAEGKKVKFQIYYTKPN